MREPPFTARTAAGVTSEPLQVFALFLASLLAARVCIAMPSGYMRTAPVWLPSAVTLAVLLRTPVLRWPSFVAASLAAHATAGLSSGYAPVLVAVRAGAAALEYTTAALIVRRWVGPVVDMRRSRDMLTLCVVAALCALAAGGVQSLLLSGAVGGDVAAAFRSWALSHPLSLVMATPCLLVLTHPSRYLETRLSPRAYLALAAMGGVALLIFAQSDYPLLFLAPPALMAVSLEAGLFGAALSVLLITTMALPATAMGWGPILLSHGDMAEKAAVLQLFLAVSLFSSLPVAALQTRWRRAEALAKSEAERARRAEAAALASEARYRSLTELSPDIIGTMDLRGQLTFVSPASTAVTGYAPEELIGRDITSLIHPDDLPAVRGNLQDLLAAEPDVSSPIEYRLRRKDGSWGWLQANPRLVRDGEGRPTGTIDVVRDVDARKEMEARVAALLDQAQSASRAKTDFLANMSHELRTPLTGILGYAHLLRADPTLSPSARTHAERIGSAGSLLLSLVNDVLDLSRAEACGVRLHLGPTDLRRVLGEAVEMVAPQAGAAGLALCSEHDGDPPLVQADADRLKQIALNLLGNAVKFTARGVITSRLQTTLRPDGLEIVFSVADTGCGIPADRLGAVFERFEQADASHSRLHGGAGLGLAISRRLARAMGGDISVESAVGRGSVFTLRLKAPLAPAPLAEAAPLTAGKPSAARDPVRVLLAEDVAMNRDLIALMLTPLGVELTPVADGLAAVEAAASAAYDLILMDVQMPIMGGLEAARRVRSGSGPSAAARIVALTANVLPEDIVRCSAAGMDAHLGKPISSEALIGEVERARHTVAVRRAA